MRPAQPLHAAALRCGRSPPEDGTTILLHVTGKTDASFVQQLLAARCDPKRHNKERPPRSAGGSEATSWT